MPMPMLSPAQLSEFSRNGFLVLRNFAPAEFCAEVVDLARADLAKQAMPIEFEADTHYPGAPQSRAAEGGTTARRLLMAAARAPQLMAWATAPQLKTILQQLLGEAVYLSLAHHNCIMTKQPAYSSMTGWHRDSRYWHFARAELVSAWLALGDEQPDNGCLWVLPGSHTWELAAQQLDEKQFLRSDRADNHPLLEQAVAVPLNRGDLLLFHSNLFHAAGRNSTAATKFSMVFTYRAHNNPPLPGSRSALSGEIAL